MKPKRFEEIVPARDVVITPEIATKVLSLATLHQPIDEDVLHLLMSIKSGIPKAHLLGEIGEERYAEARERIAGFIREKRLDES